MSVISLVSDPQFMKLNPGDQQAALAGLDPDFGKLNSDDFNTAVTGLQRQALSRPDLVTPPKAAGPRTSLQEVDMSGNPQTQWSGFQGAPPAPEWAIPHGPAADAVANVARGFVKSAAQTIAPGPRNAARINAATGLNVPSTRTPELQTQGAAEGVGAGMEGVGEFLLGDEALKGLSLAERAGLLTRVAKLAESHPVIAKALKLGMDAVRGGTATALQQTAHGATPTEALATGATATGLGVGAGVTAESLRALWNTGTGKTLQSALQTGIRGVLSDTASDAGVVPVKSPAVRNSASALADAVESKSKGLYRQIDNATDGEFTNIQNKIRNVEQKLREIAGTDDDAEERLFNQKVALGVRLDEAVEAAKRAGVPPKFADEARATWRQASALRDLDSQIKASTFGNVKNAPEVVDPKKLVMRLQKLEDSGRLADALGKDQADALMEHAYDSAKSARRLSAAKKIVGGAVGTAMGGGVLYEGAKAFGSGQ